MKRFAHASEAHKMEMRIYGAICAALGISFFAIFLANGRAYGHGRVDRYIVEYAIVFWALAIGLLATKIWAEIIFDFCLLLVSAGIVISVITDAVEPSQLILDVCIIALLVTPVALSVFRLRNGTYFLRGT